MIVVSSVSCIYGLGEPEDFAKMMVSLRVGSTLERDELLRRLVEIRYERNDIAFERNMFRYGGYRGDLPGLLEGHRHPGGVLWGRDRPASARSLWSPAVIRNLNHIPIWPATHYVTPKEKMDAAIRGRSTGSWRSGSSSSKTTRAAGGGPAPLKRPVLYDIEMMQELGYLLGIGELLRVIEGRPVGSPPHTPAGLFSQGLCPLHRRGRDPPQVRAVAQRRPAP